MWGQRDGEDAHRREGDDRGEGARLNRSIQPVGVLTRMHAHVAQIESARALGVSNKLSLRW